MFANNQLFLNNKIWSKKTIVIISFLFFFLNSNGQINKYSKFINEDLIDKTQTVEAKGGKQEIVYLGTIKNSKGKILFHVLTIYREVPAAIVVHRNSNVIYFDNNKIFKKEFDLDSPAELPFKLKNNKLYFHYLNSKTGATELFINTVGTEIPKLLCIQPNDCY